MAIAESPTKGRQTRAKRAESGRQASLDDFFGGKPLPQPRTHRLLVSDSKTRASGSMPREEDTLAGRLQVMLYKELLDALLMPRESTVTPQESRIEVEGDELEVEAKPPDTPPDAYLPTSSQQGSGLWRIWEHLVLDTSSQFTDEFVAQTRPIVESNELRFGVREGRTLADYAQSWTRYVAALGLGAGPDECRTDTSLELIYRRAAPKRKEATRKRRKDGKSRGRRRREPGEALAVPPTSEIVDLGALDEDAQMEIAIRRSFQESQDDRTAPSQTLGEAQIAETPLSTAGRSDEPANTFHGPQPSLGEQLPPQVIEATEVTGGEQLCSEPPHASSAGGSPGNEVAEMKPHDPPGDLTASQHADSAISSSALGIGRPNLSASPRLASSQTKYLTSDSEQEREDAELAWAVEMGLAGSQDTAPSGVGVMSPPERRRTRSRSPAASGSIIGRHRFEHDAAALGGHLRWVLQYWRGTREPLGVGPAHVRRCHWCEFEDGCEWR